MRKHFSIKISGMVQGVFFRASTKAKADSLNLHGIVRNERDGSVYTEAEGEEEDLKQFIKWCHEGPPRAKVERCEVEEGPIKNFNRFLIER
jgi:acylphosphatase